MINTNENTLYEGGPAKSDLIINLLAGITLLGLPFTFAAIVRALWLKYKITNTPMCKNLRSGWLQTLLYQESTTWSKNRGVNLMRPQNVACNTCRGTR